MLNTPSNILGAQSGVLNELIEHSTKLQALTAKIRQCLPPYLASHCTVAAWEGETLIVHSTNAAAGTVLRYQLPKLLPLLQADPNYASIQQVTCHIRPPLAQPTAQKASAPKHSVYTASLLQSTAETLSPEVQSALQRLASTLQKKGS
jgi:hypothetical protein